MRALPLIALPLALLAPAATAQGFTYGIRNTDFAPAFPEQTRAPLAESGVELATETLAGGLDHPWGIATLPDGGGWLVTERAGRLRHLAADGTLSEPIAGLPEVLARGQGGLLDVALAPDFARTGTILITYAEPVDGGSATAAARMTLSEDRSEVAALRELFVQAPPSPTPKHYGSRIVALPDGTLAITSGKHSSDAESLFAQDLDKTCGKVIRVDAEGAAPADNPFVERDGAVGTIWSYGHRNIQGAAVDAGGTLWIIEHGP